MPVQTRAKAPANRVYSSPAAQQQIRFRPRKQNVASRRSLGVLQRSRQQTLTQIDFVNLQEAMDHDDDENETHEEGHTRKRKRRRTEGDAPSSTSSSILKPSHSSNLFRPQPRGSRTLTTRRTTFGTHHPIKNKQKASAPLRIWVPRRRQVGDESTKCLLRSLHYRQPQFEARDLSPRALR